MFDKTGNAEEELNTLQQSLEVRKEFNDFQGQSADNLQIGNVLLEQNNLDDAIAYLENSVRFSEQSNQIETKKMALRSLSSLYDRRGNYIRALEIYKEYVATSEKAAIERKQEILKNLELMQSLTKRLQRIDMLENQKLLDSRTIQVMEQEQAFTVKSVKQQRFIIIALSLVLLLLLTAVYLIRKSALQKRIANQLLALKSLRSPMNPLYLQCFEFGQQLHLNE